MAGEEYNGLLLDVLGLLNVCRADGVLSPSLTAPLRGGEAARVIARRPSINSTTQHHNTSTINANVDDSYSSIEAELDSLKKQIQQLKRSEHQCESSTSSETNIREDDNVKGTGEGSTSPLVPKSAAAILREIHERSGQLSSGQSSPSLVVSHDRPLPTFEDDSFPALGDTPRLAISEGVPFPIDGGPQSLDGTYAGIFKEHQKSDCSKLQGTLTTASVIREVEASPTGSKIHWENPAGGHSEDDKRGRHNTRHILTSSKLEECPPIGFGSTHTADKRICDTKAYNHVGHHENSSAGAAAASPSKLASKKRVADRPRRNALPEAWLSETDRARHSDQASEKPSEAHSSKAKAHTNSRLTQSKSPSKADTRGRPVHSTHRGQIFGYTDDEPVPDRHVQAVSETPHSLPRGKSPCSLDPRSKVRTCRTSNFATPTAASKHRAVDPAKLEVSAEIIAPLHRTQAPSTSLHSPFKGENTAFSRLTLLSKDVEQLQSPQKMIDHATTQSSQSLCLDSHNRDNDDTTDTQKVHGRSVYHRRLESYSKDENIEGIRKTNKHLKIKVPPSGCVTSRAASPSGPTRIPRPTQISNVPSELLIPTTQPAHESPARRTIVASTPNTSSDLQEDSPAKCLSGGRAVLLGPIVRRLSSATPLISPSGSGSLTGPRPVRNESIRENESMHDSCDVNPKHGPGLVEPCAPSVQISPGGTFDSASSWLLNKIKQNAAEFAVRQNAVPNMERVERTLRVNAAQARAGTREAVRCFGTRRSHIHRMPTMPTNLQDPASSMGQEVRSETVQLPRPLVDNPERCFKVSSLRASAPTFVPGMTSSHTLQGGFDPHLSVGVPITTEQPTTPLAPAKLKVMAQSSRSKKVAKTAKDLWMSQEKWSSMSRTEKIYARARRRSLGQDNRTSASSPDRDSGPAPAAVASPWISKPENRESDWFTSARLGSPIKLGRGPIPLLHDVRADVKGWGIGSAAPSWWYGWRGGDGREISFVGHGPDAERYPDAPINFHNYQEGIDGRGNYLHPPSTPKRNSTGLNYGAPTAPRKMVNLATRMGYPQVPCGDFEITHAVEHVANAYTRGSVDGWCHKCVAPH